MRHRGSAICGALCIVFAAASGALAQGAPRTFACPAPAPAAMCGNPEFQSCGIDVPDSGGVNVRRHFCIHVPGRPQGELPAVWAFHGRTGDARVMVGFLQDQTEQGMVLVSPAALEEGRACVPAWRTLGPEHRDDWTELDTGADLCAAAPTTDNDADLHMVEAVMDEIDLQLDPAGHWALGFSSGAGMAYQLMITAPLSARFRGFAMLANAMNEAKLAASGGGASGPWSAETEIAHPVLGQQGTADRLFVPVTRMIERVDALVAQGGWPAGHPCATADTPETVLGCWRSEPMIQGAANNYYEDRGLRTREWLLRRNRPQRRAVESLYPDLGHGRDASLREEDATATVRREWPATRRPGSQPVVWLHTIDAAHTIAGARGAYPPCPTRHCDIDAIREVLQFWRANAGLRTRWP